MPRTSVSPDFRALFESAPGLYLALAPDFTIVAVSEAYLRATMTRREEILGRGIFDVFPDNPNDDAATGTANLRASLNQVLLHRRPDTMAVQKYDIRKPEVEGGGFEERFWSPVNSPVLQEDGAIAYLVHQVEDVTEFVRLKHRQAELSQITDDLRTRAGTMEAEVYRRAQEIQEANRALRALQGELEERVQARTADLSRTNEALQNEIRERKKAEEALRRSEDQLRQSQKMEAIGRLAGGIAHDFNNLLSVVLGTGELVLGDLAATDPMRGDVEQIVTAGRRAAELTRQLLAFSRQQVLETRVLDLNDILHDLNKMLQRLLGEDIELRMSLSPDLAKLRADRSQIEQILMNLVVNARDALATGGTLTIETANVELDEAYAREHLGVRPGPYVMLAVSDSGAGMDSATQARIFEPFFTTKERGKGTGLGLSTVFGIVQQSGGSIWLYSEPGAGTTFKIYLPRADETGGLASSEPTAAPPRAATETVLLVEDDPQVRHVACLILRRAGYLLLEASTPREALQIVQRYPGRIDLLLTDVVMPVMNGQKLSEQVIALRPGIKVLFMSGYTDDVILHRGVLEPGFALVEKPLTPVALNRKVRQVLDGAPA